MWLDQILNLGPLAFESDMLLTGPHSRAVASSLRLEMLQKEGVTGII